MSGGKCLLVVIITGLVSMKANFTGWESRESGITMESSFSCSNSGIASSYGRGSLVNIYQLDFDLTNISPPQMGGSKLELQSFATSLHSSEGD